MDSQNKNTVFSHAASCARLNECTAAASVGELRALLKKSCAEINSAYRLVEARFGSAAAMPSTAAGFWITDILHCARQNAPAAHSETFAGCAPETTA